MTFGRLRSFFLAAAAAAPAVLALPGALAAETISMADFSRRVWKTALDDRPDEVIGLLSRLPADSDDPAVRELRAAFDRRSAHIAEAETKRQARFAEVAADLEKHLNEGKLLEALKSAVEKQALTPETGRAALLSEPSIARVVAQAEKAAREAESKGEWLDAQELFYRLHLLYEESGRFRPDVDRLGRRLVMLRLYAPERLHQMRNTQRVRNGEANLPPYNPIGDDWAAKLEGINQSMLVNALNITHRSQVDGADMAKMITGGLRALRVMATTPDLAEAFPGLEDAGKRREFVNVLDDETRRLEGRTGKAGYFDLTQSLQRVLRASSTSVRIPEAALLHEFGNGAMETLDEYSAVIWPDELRRFQKSTQGRFVGIGVQISLDEASNLEVVTPIDGTPAQRAGLRRGDLIKEIDGESTLGISTQQAVDKITGERGRPVTLTIERKGVDQPFKVTIVRDVIPIYTVKGWRRNGPHETDWDWFVDPENGIGYVRLSQFTEETSRELRAAAKEMRRQGLSGLIVDLRFNPGGLLTEAVNVASMFVDRGVIVSQHDAAGAERDVQRAVPGAAIFADIPVVVLVNEGAASASEIVAGCLQDYAKALIVGSRSFGKGSVQNVYPLAQGIAALKLTTQYYQLPKGRLIHRREGKTAWGVEPDFLVPMLPQQIADSLELRQDADLLPDPDAPAHADPKKNPDPDRLLSEGIDPQLETAVLLLRTQTLGARPGQVTLMEPRQGVAIGG